MPEMPEMQALAERLDDVYRGATLKGAQPIQFSGLKTFDPPVESLIGSEVKAVGRRGKFVIFDFGGPRLMMHLSQGGRVDIEDPPKRNRPKMGVVRLTFDDRPAMLVKEFGTERKAGWWVIAEADEGPLARLGPEPTSQEFESFVMTSSDGRRIHTLLRDQKTVAGVGRGYSDDALHHAQLSPYASLKSMSDAERKRLVKAIREVMDEGLEKERKRTGGLPTKIGDHWIVHGRSGEPCPRCGETLRRVSYESHEVTYCPACQTEGKVLADRRLSRLLK